MLIVSLIILLSSFLFNEILAERIWGDKHKKKSKIRLVLTIVLAELIFIPFGIYLGALAYLFLRLAIFDLSWGKLFQKNWWYLSSNPDNWWDTAIAQCNKTLLLIVRIISFIDAILILYLFS